jgi:hypothetical protein
MRLLKSIRGAAGGGARRDGNCSREEGEDRKHGYVWLF